MRQLKTALVVLDKPKHTQAALERALALQATAGTALQLVSFCWSAICEHREVFDVHQRRSMRKELLRAREAWLFDLLRDRGIAAENLTVEVVWARDIAGWIADAAEARRVDLVLKSVHRTRTLMHTPLDWALLRTCPTPVLSVAAPAGRRPRPAGRDVLATVDLRHADRKHRMLNLRVLDAAQRFADLSGGRLHCVSVVEYSEVLRDLDILDARTVKRDVISRTEDLLEALVEPYGIAKNRIHRPAGKVGQMVATIARKVGAGLIVVGSTTRRKAGVELIGNSAEKILDRSPCDVLTVHP
jgi:universal stress protein E